MPDRSVTLNEAARLLGRNRSTLSAWLAKGCPAEAVADRGAGEGWQLDLGAVFEWYTREAVERARAAAAKRIDALEAQIAALTGDALEVPIEEARRRKAAAAARLLELEVAEREGAVARLDEITDAIVATATAVKTRILGVPSALAPFLAAESTPRGCFKLLEDALREALEEIADAQVVVDRATRRRPPRKAADEAPAAQDEGAAR